MYIKHTVYIFMAQGLLNAEELLDVPIAVLVNKIDVPGAMGEGEIIQASGLQQSTTGKHMVIVHYIY